MLALVPRAASERKGARAAWLPLGGDFSGRRVGSLGKTPVLNFLELSVQAHSKAGMRGQYRVGALMQAVATASAALLRGGSSRAPRATLRMTQVDTGGLGAPDICVLGGGFGGLYTALRLSKLDWGDAPRPRVTLVDQQERFVFLPMLYEVATGAASCWEVKLAHCRAARRLT